MSWLGENRRQHPRYPVQLKARVLFQGAEVPGSTRDLSRGGICMVSTESVVRGAWIRILLSLELNRNAFSEDLEVGGKVIWCTDLGDDSYQLGISFDNLDDEKTNYLDIFLRLLKGEIVLDLPEGGQPGGER